MVTHPAYNLSVKIGESALPTYISYDLVRFFTPHDRLIISSTSKEMFDLFFDVKANTLHILSTAIWKLVDKHIVVLTQTDSKCANSVYELYKHVNTIRIKNGLTSINSISAMLSYRYFKCLKPVLILQSFLFKINQIDKLQFSFSHKSHRCSWGNGDCHGKVAIVVNTSKEDSTFVAKFVFCEHHLDHLKRNFPLFFTCKIV